MKNCALCTTELKFTNIPLVGGVTNDGRKICTYCIKKLNRTHHSIVFNLKDYTVDDLKPYLKSELNNSKPRNKLSKILLLLLIAIVVLIIYNVSGIGDKEAVYTKEQLDSVYFKENKLMAELTARDFAKDGLLSPSSAEFTSSRVWYLKDSTFMVKGDVNGKNAFGVVLRHYFECKVKQIDKNNWTLLHRELVQY